jgi:hypothetical protein
VRQEEEFRIQESEFRIQEPEASGRQDQGRA